MSVKITCFTRLLKAIPEAHQTGTDETEIYSPASERFSCPMRKLSEWQGGNCHTYDTLCGLLSVLQSIFDLCVPIPFYMWLGVAHAFYFTRWTCFLEQSRITENPNCSPSCCLTKNLSFSWRLLWYDVVSHWEILWWCHLFLAFGFIGMTISTLSYIAVTCFTL